MFRVHHMDEIKTNKLYTAQTTFRLGVQNCALRKNITVSCNLTFHCT